VLLDLNDILFKPHVEHLVTFVQNLELAVIKCEALILQKVNQSAWCAHEDVWAYLLDLTHLNSARGPTTIYQNGFEVSELLDLSLDLRCQLTCRLQNDCLNAVMLLGLSFFVVSD